MLLNAPFDNAINVVFNHGTMSDKHQIEELGGPTRVAELLGYDKARGGVQRVQNWITRGIPAKVKLERPDLFPYQPTESSANSPDKAAA
jgi:hypothetical protein